MIDEASIRRAVNPSHYTELKPEPIDVIEAWGLDKDFCLANVVRYVSRAGKKDPAKTLEDIRKARWYLDREIARLELEPTPSDTPS